MSNDWDCPYCGKKVDKPRAAWSVRTKSPTRYTVMGHFLCDNCGRAFRMAIGTRISSHLPRPHALVSESIPVYETEEQPKDIIKEEIPGLFSEREIDELSDEFVEGYSVRNLPNALYKEFRLSERYIMKDFPDYWEFKHTCFSGGPPIDLHRQLVRSLWKKFRKIYHVKVIESLHKNGYIELADIHCPKRKGCVGTYHEESSAREERSFRLRVFGFGGGKGVEAKIGIGKKIEARDGNCYSLVVPTTFLIEKCDLFRWGVRRRRFYRVSVTDIKNNFRKCLIPPSLDNCQIATSDLKAQQAEWTIECWDSSESSENEVDEYVCYLESGTTSSFSAKIGLPWTSSDVGISTEVSLINKIRYAYQLKGGCKYYAYRPQNHLGYYWAIEQIKR